MGDLWTDSFSNSLYGIGSESVIFSDLGNTAPISTPISAPSSDFDLFKTIQNVGDYGLKIYGAIAGAEAAKDNIDLQRYLAENKADAAMLSAKGNLSLAEKQLEYQTSIAQAKINAANTGGVATNLGQSVGNNSLMLWLTVIGLGFAAIQAFKS